MSRAREWYRWKRRAGVEFRLQWAVAFLTYVVGDIVSTVILVYFVPGLGEGNPLVAGLLETFGLAGLIVVKGGVFALGLFVSRRGLADEDAAFYYLPPVAMTGFGGVATTINLWLVFG